MHHVDEHPDSNSAVILVHGTPSWSYEYRHVIHGLRAKHRCLAPDHLGFGFSERPRRGLLSEGLFDYSLQSHSKNLESWWQGVSGKERIQKLSLVLHDFGGPIGMPFLLEHWDAIDRLVILNSWLWPFPDVDPAAAAKLKWVKSRWMKWLYLKCNFSAQMMVRLSWGRHRKLTRELHDGYRQLFPDTLSRVGTWAFAQAVVDSDAYLRQLREELRRKQQERPKKALVIWGMADGFVTAANLGAWEEILRPERVVRLEGVGHFPQDEAFELVVPEIAEFLK